MAVTDQRLRRGAALLSVSVLAGLVCHNVYWLVKNQGELPPNDRPHRSPRDIEEVARQNPQSKINGQMATYHHLAQRIPGAAVTLTPRFEADRWFFERVARLKVEMIASRLVIAPKKLRRLREQRTAALRWRVPRGNGKHGTIGLNIWLDPGVDAYVMAERRDGRELFLLPSAEYPAVADRP